MYTRHLEATFEKAFSEADRSVDVIASTAAVDAYDEVIDQESWSLERYKRNPVVLWNHNRGSSFDTDPTASIPIGTASNIRVEGGALRARITFAAAELSPRAQAVWLALRAGLVRAVSVGFTSGSSVQEVRAGRTVRVLKDNTLHEISVVAIPANAEALVQRALGASPVTERDVIEHIRLVASADPSTASALDLVDDLVRKASHPASPPPGLPSDLSGILQDILGAS